MILCATSEYFSKACEDTFKVHESFYSFEILLISIKEGPSGQIRLQEDDPDMVHNMLRFLYTLTYQDDASGRKRLSTNANMYAIADKYRIDALKDLARDKFSRILDAGWDITDFLEVIETVYTTTPASDRGLRDRLAPVLLEHKDELHDNEVFVSLIKDKLSDGEFAMDVIHAWTEFSSLENGFPKKRSPINCKHCKRSLDHCPHCYESFS